MGVAENLRSIQAANAVFPDRSIGDPNVKFLFLGGRALA